MGYWKREYTERKGGKPLFKPEPKEPQEPKAEREAVSENSPEGPTAHSR